LDTQRWPPPGRGLIVPPFWIAQVHPIASGIFLHSGAIWIASAADIMNINASEIPMIFFTLPSPWRRSRTTALAEIGS
jgi:hypothetical protein